MREGRSKGKSQAEKQGRTIYPWKSHPEKHAITQTLYKMPSCLFNTAKSCMRMATVATLPTEATGLERFVIFNVQSSQRSNF